MNKKCRKVITLIAAVCILLQMFVFSASAADKANMQISNIQPLVGQTFNVTIKVSTTASSGIGSIDGVLSYDTAELDCTKLPSGTYEKTSGTIKMSYFAQEAGKSSYSFTFTFKAIKAGSATLSFSGDHTDFELEKPNNPIATSYKMTVIDKSSLPNDANLKGIKLSAGSLSPSFSASTTSYTAKVPYSTTKVVVTPTLSDSKAKWSISGSATLKVGTNTRVITVTAQNGSTKKYTINIIREADTSSPSSSDSTSSEDTEPKVNPYEISVNGEMWLLLNDYSLITVPSGFSQDKQIINGIEMPVLVDKKNGRTIVYATNEADTVGAYFIYTGEDNEYTEYKFFVTDSNTYVIVEPEKVPTAPKGFKYKVSEVMGYEIGVYEYTDSAYSDFVIFFAENPSGEKNYYRYDRKEATIQKATDFIVALEKENSRETNSGNIIEKFIKLDMTEKVIVCSAAALVLLIIALVIVNIVKLSSGKKHHNNETLINMDDDAEPLNFEGILNGEQSDEE